MRGISSVLCVAVADVQQSSRARIAWPADRAAEGHTNLEIGARLFISPGPRSTTAQGVLQARHQLPPAAPALPGLTRTAPVARHTLGAGPRHGPAAVDRRIHRTVVASKPGLDKRGMRWMKVALRA